MRLASLALSRRWTIVALAAPAAMAASAIVGTAPVQHALDGAAWSVSRHDPSRGVVVVEIDSRSRAEIPDWPWPRSLHGRVAVNLARAGAARIAFDMAFRSPAADPSRDASFAAGLAEARTVTGRPVGLPVVTDEDDGRVSVYAPIPALLREATPISIWTVADDDFVIRELSTAGPGPHGPIPTLAAHLAGVGASPARSFPIDWSIRKDAVPHLSYVDVLRGRFDPAVVRGRAVVVGATAQTMGDRFTVPMEGSIPGVYVQAIGAETLIEGVGAVDGPTPAALATLLVLAAMLAMRRTRRAAAPAALAMAALLPALAVAVLHERIPSATALTGALAAVAAQIALAVLSGVVGRAMRFGGDGMPNGLAMAMRPPAGRTTLVLRLRNHLEAVALLGPAAGDAIVAETVRRIASVWPDATLHRIDDGTFALRTDDDRDAASARIDALHSAFLDGIPVAGGVVDASMSVGAASDADVPAAIAHALYAAVDSVRTGTRWTHHDDAERDAWSLGLLSDMDRAIADGDLWVAYQPKLDVATGAIRGAEALARWTHPVRGNVPPDAFIPQAERSGRIEGLTMHVLETAIRDFAAMPTLPSVAVNVSMTLVGRGLLVGPVVRMLREHGMAPGRLTLEVTETAAINGPGTIRELQLLRDLGIGVSIDDYGTGLANLSHVRTLPADELKIDRSFVAGIVGSGQDRAMVASTVELAHRFGMRVVAEGVEDEATLAALATLGCDVAQGWHVGRPVPIAAFLERIDAGTRAAA